MAIACELISGTDNLAALFAPLAGRPGRPQGLPYLVGQSPGFEQYKRASLASYRCFFVALTDNSPCTATFRTHNALDAWLPNVYGLMAVQQWVCPGIGILAPGPITVVSHSISIDRKELDRALAMISHRAFVIREDPCGYFRLSLDEGEILVEHRHGDVTLKEYRDKKATRLQHQLARDLALSDLNHALYLGRQLARAEECLRTGREFEQE